jgi:hypothetical protein
LDLEEVWRLREEEIYPKLFGPAGCAHRRHHAAFGLAFSTSALCQLQTNFAEEPSGEAHQ